MIDLRYKLQDTIKSGDDRIVINTDFRAWINFSEILREYKTSKKLGDLRGFFPSGYPQNNDFIDEMMKFYSKTPDTPRSKGSSTDELLDLIRDGAYIYASFLQAYGIDLVDIEHLHWHKFQALLISLPETAKLQKIIEYRAFKKSKKSSEAFYYDQKRAWKLPSREDCAKIESLNKYMNQFYNC
jgi:Bacteriophage Gp15 protein